MYKTIKELEEELEELVKEVKEIKEKPKLPRAPEIGKVEVMVDGKVAELEYEIPKPAKEIPRSTVFLRSQIRQSTRAFTT